MALAAFKVTILANVLYNARNRDRQTDQKHDQCKKQNKTNKNETANLTNQQLSYQNSKIKLLLDCNKATKKLQTRGGRNVYNKTIASLLQRKKNKISLHERHIFTPFS